jgi:hypothetical protein
MGMSRGIPTLYRGVQYRSRLEARWAALFGLLGWRFQYEPFDLDDWIPDFLLLLRVPALVEVKPVAWFPEDVASRIEGSRPPHAPMIVGCTLVEDPDRADDFDPSAVPFLGWTPCDDGDGWTPAGLGSFEETPSVLDLFASRSARPPIGFASGLAPLDRRRGFFWQSGETRRLWHEAGNLVQWRGRRSEARA